MHADSSRGLGPWTQKHLRGLTLSFLEHPSGGQIVTPLTHIQFVAQTAGLIIHVMLKVLAITVHGSGVYQQPKNFPKQMLERSIVLDRMTTAATYLMHPSIGQLLPPSPLHGQHLNEWRETADYAATTLAVLAGTVDLETGFTSPLLGEPGMY
jgi:hypothetical protein